MWRGTGATPPPRGYFEEALRTNRELGYQGWDAALLVRLGNAARDQGDYAPTRAFYSEAKDINDEGRRVHHRLHAVGVNGALWQANILHNLGKLDDEGNPASAHALWKESLVIRRDLPDERGIASWKRSPDRPRRKGGRSERRGCSVRPRRCGRPSARPCHPLTVPTIRVALPPPLPRWTSKPSPRLGPRGRR